MTDLTHPRKTLRRVLAAGAATVAAVLGLATTAGAQTSRVDVTITFDCDASTVSATFYPHEDGLFGTLADVPPAGLAGVVTLTAPLTENGAPWAVISSALEVIETGSEPYPCTAEVRSFVVQRHVGASVTPAAPAPGPVAGKPVVVSPAAAQLPATGSPTLALVGVGLALLGAGLTVRRVATR